jgi:hypothetical protein
MMLTMTGARRAQGQRHESIQQQQHASEQLRPRDQRKHIASLRKGGGEGCSAFGHGFGLWKKLKKAVEAEENEDDTQ